MMLNTNHLNDNMNKTIVLLIEPQEWIGNLHAVALRQDGYYVRLVPDAVQAATYMNCVQPDVIILDMDLPDFGAYQVMRYLRHHNLFDRVQLVALADPKRTQPRLLVKLAATVLNKPVRVNVLRERVRDLVLPPILA